MYNAQISFVLVRKPLGRRFLQDTISGKEIQSDVAQGYYSDNSTMKDYLVKFDCETGDGETDSNYYISRLQLDEPMEKNLMLQYQVRILKTRHF